MLNFLQIRNFTIVEALDLEFSNGFTCITGETGAGKSILVGALGLLCGNRADTSTVRDGAAKAEMSAGFELAGESPALAWLRERELDDAGSCLLRRIISAGGRSRAWINGTAVTLQQLASLGELLVEIHGQNEHIRLVRSDEQFRLLDGAKSHDRELKDVRRSHNAWRALKGEQESLLEETAMDAGDIDFMRFQISELESAMLTAAEFSALEQEHRILARGGEVLESLESSIQALEPGRAGPGMDISGAVDRLETHASLDPDIAGAVSLLREAAINCDEARLSLQAARARIDLSPERLAELENKLSLQHDLARKHRSEPDQLEEVLQRLKERHELTGSLDRRLAELEQELRAALKTYREAARRLHERRRARASELAVAVTSFMQELGMEGGTFEFAVSRDDECEPSARGSDRLELRVSANPGTAPGPLRKVASGGELSRVSLAIKVASKSDAVAGPGAVTQVFDEVDAGIGGDTANAVGALLRSLAGSGQSLCVTHLAQVAVFADHQLQVLKTSDQRETRVETSLLADDERIEEIARMLGGRLSDQSRAHASELLAAASVKH